MAAVARRDHPGPRFGVGSMTDLPLADGSVAGVLAWWSLIHVPDHAIPAVLGHFHRVLRPGGPLQAGFHVGDETRLKTRGYGDHPMHVHIHRRRPATMATWLREAGFTVEAHLMLDPDGNAPQAILCARRV
jgi:ubiquinone/menaquinone biosynthesis C-methylase UbiE